MSDECHLEVSLESAGAPLSLRGESAGQREVSLEAGTTVENVEEVGSATVLSQDGAASPVSTQDDEARTVELTGDSGLTVVQSIEGTDTAVIGNQPSPVTGEDDDFETPVEDDQPPTADDSIREFLADFDTASRFLSNGASLTRRPDAISLDYLTAYSIGPIADGDTSGGTRARVWRARAVNDEAGGNGQIFLAYSDDENTEWIGEVLLFSYSGIAKEIDLAFEQAARPVIALEINGRINLYWFDPTPSAFVITDFDDGRNPRVLLDSPHDTSNSDVLLFYVRDASDAVVYRQQRDRYATRYDSPLVNVGSKFLEEVIRTSDNRLAVIASVRNTVTGKYSLQRRETALYPFIVDADSMDVTQLVQSGNLEIVILFYDATVEGLDVAQLIQSGTLASPIILYVAFDNDALDVAQAVQAGTLAVVVLVVVAFDNDALDVAQLIQAGTLTVIVITYTAFDNDALDVSQLIQSGTLAP